MHYQLKLPSRTPPQKRISDSDKRFNVACWGRQSGKTTFGVLKMLYKPMQGRPYGIYWYILQTYSAAQVAFQRYLDLARKGNILFQKNLSQRWVQLPNGSKVFFKSGKNYEDLRAETLDGCIIDEVRQQDPNLWTSVIRPMLSRRKGWCDFLSTSNGFEHFYDLYQFAISNPEEWATFHAPSTEAFWWTSDELVSAKSTMSEDEFAQEILAEFREIGKGKVYISHGQWNHVVQNPFAVTGLKWCPYLPILVGLDFNVGHMSWILGQNRLDDFYFGEEISIKNTNTQEASKVLVNRVKDHLPGVVLIGDASGKSNKTSASGETDYSIICQTLRINNIPFKNLTPEANPSVKDRVNRVNSRLKSADGKVHLFYNPKACPALKKDFERLTWKEGTDGAILDKTNPELSHMSDAAGYPISVLSKEWHQSPGVLRIVGA